jgi:hypothetical protein
VIVEFCLYGNLQKFILANRPHFINQINPETGHILVQQALYLFVKHINTFMQDTIRTHPFFHQSYFLKLNLFFLFFVNRPHFINQMNPETGHILVQQALYLFVKHINPLMPDPIRTRPFFHQSYFLQLNLFFLRQPSFLCKPNVPGCRSDETFLYRDKGNLVILSFYFISTRSSQIQASFSGYMHFINYKIPVNKGSLATLYRKSDLCIPRNETARPCAPNTYLHVSVLRFISSQIRECGNWETEHYISILELTRPRSFISGNT